MDGCLPVERLPGDGKPYFFGEGFGGLAAERNVLWGDVFLVDSEGDRAEGLRAVPVPADPTIEGGLTFYVEVVSGGADRRLPLPALHRTRFLHGPGLDTDLIVWSQNMGNEPLSSFEGRCEALTSNPNLTIRGRDESSDQDFASGLFGVLSSFRLPVGSSSLPVPVPFGTLEVESFFACHNCSGGPYDSPVQSWVGALTGAQGRYAVGLEAVGLGPCR